MQAWPKAAKPGKASARARVAAVACVAAMATATCAHAAQRVLIVASADSGEFVQSGQGVREAAGAVPVERLTIGITPEAGLRAALGQASRDTVVVALGQRAAILVASVDPSAPVIGCMLHPPVPLTRSANRQTVSRRIPVDAQIEWLKRLMPQARTVGVLYDPADDVKHVGDVAAELRKNGIDPLLETVERPSALPGALVNLASVDALMVESGSGIDNAQMEKSLALFSFRHKVPLIGLSDAWVKKGALYALDWDYREFGAYCGQLALRQLKGSHGPAPTPPRPRLIVNLRTAKWLHFHWAGDVRASVDRTYD